MRYEPGHKAKTHRRIVRNAAHQFRAHGLGGPGVGSVMSASGLTIGGFYKHFRNREHLIGEAIEEGLAEFGGRLLEIARQAPPGEGWKAIVRWYLSADHCEHSGTGCPIAALSSEIARATPGVRKRVTGVMRAVRGRLMEFMPGRSSPEKEKNFVIIFTSMAGAISIARMMPDAAERERLLTTVREHLVHAF